MINPKTLAPLIWSAVFLLSGYALRAQADTTKYRERAVLINQEVWAWKLPAFSNYKVPAEYANESSVIMARRATIEASTKRTFWMGASRNYYYNSTVRELVKINDKASLDEYSQLSYNQFKRLNGWISVSATTFVGARIIKPDGKIREISLDESVVMQSTSGGTQRKLAIGGLEIGDFLDYFIRVEEFSVNIKEPERLIYYFGDDHPILDYSIHCDIGEKYSVNYLSMNHAPEPKTSTGDDKNVIMDMDVRNIPAIPTGLWMSSIREVPAFRINVMSGAYGHRPAQLADKDELLVDALRSSMPYADVAAVNLIRPWVTKVLHDYDPHYSRLPKDSLAHLIYYAYRFALYYNRSDGDQALQVGEDRNHMELNTRLYLSCLRFLLSVQGINAEYVAMPSRFGPDINYIMGPGDLVLMLRVDIDQPFFVTCDNMFSCPGFMPSYSEGQPYMELNERTLHRGARPNLDNLVPVSAADQNMHKENLLVDISGADMQLLHVKRKTLLSGNVKIDEQVRLLNFEDCYETERAALHVDKSIMDELKKARRSKNLSQDYTTALQKARESLKDRFNDEIEGEFDQAPKELIRFAIDNPGLRHYAPDLTYSTEFTLDGLVQRAGNNYLLNIGKTISSPIKVTASQRTRKVDVYMPFARTLECSVAFNIPQGFTVVGADKLNKKVENGCGSVVSTATIQGNQLVLHFKRIYNNNYEQADRWPQLLAILDACTDFAGQKVLLKKG